MSATSCSARWRRADAAPHVSMCHERQADPDHGCHQWHWPGGGGSARRPRRESRHRRPQQEQNAGCLGPHQGGGREGSDGGDIRLRPIVAGLRAQIGRRGAGPLSKVGCARQQCRRDVRNTAADDGRHRTDLGGQPPGAVPAHHAAPRPAEGERAGPDRHDRIRGASASTHPVRAISTPSAPIGALAATAKPSWPISSSRRNWRDVSRGPG